jgi:hypothetical protein
MQHIAVKATGGFSGLFLLTYATVLMLIFSSPTLANGSCNTEVEFSTPLSSELKTTLLSAFNLEVSSELDSNRVQLKDQSNNTALKGQLAALANIPEVRLAEFRCENTERALQESISQLTLAATPQPKTEDVLAHDDISDVGESIPAALVDKTVPVAPAIIGGLSIDTPVTECQASILFSALATADQRARVYEDLNVIPSGQQANGSQLVKPFFSLDTPSPYKIAGDAQAQALVVEAGVVCP